MVPHEIIRVSLCVKSQCHFEFLLFSSRKSEKFLNDPIEYLAKYHSGRSYLSTEDARCDSRKEHGIKIFNTIP